MTERSRPGQRLPNLKQPLSLRLRSHSFNDFRNATSSVPSEASEKGAARKKVIPVLTRLPNEYLAEDDIGDVKFSELSLQDARHELWSPVVQHCSEDKPVKKKQDSGISLNEPNNISSAAIFTANHLQSQGGTYSTSFGDGVVGLTGLSNLGNTCFMNAAIQCLSATIPLTRHLRTGVYKTDLNRENPMGCNGLLARATAKLFSVLWSQEHSHVSPVALREAIIKFRPQFEGYEQQDSQELFSFLIDGLHEDLNVIKKKPDTSLSQAAEDELERMPSLLAAEKEWRRSLKRDESIITHLFSGQERSRLTCKTCRATSTTWSNFMQISLAIPKKPKKFGYTTAVSLAECLEDYLKNELLPVQDGWECPKCKIARSAVKTMAFTRLPPVLVLHIQRTVFTDYGLADKDDRPVQYPLHDFDAGNFITRSCTDGKPKLYDLYGIVNHVGAAESGHYTASIRSREGWYNISDARVKRTSASSVKKCFRSAYLLFYHLKEFG